jgi:hypothetical protein
MEKKGTCRHVLGAAENDLLIKDIGPLSSPRPFVGPNATLFQIALEQ